MTSNALFSFAIAASVGLNFLAGIQLLKLRRQQSDFPIYPAEASAAMPFEIPPGEPFPAVDAVTVNESLSPLMEAEIYWTYGRLDDAEFVLGEGLRSGRIDAEDIRQFWQSVAK